jgi:hypothetical protein
MGSPFATATHLLPKRSPFVRSDHQANGRIDPAISPAGTRWAQALGTEMFVPRAGLTHRPPYAMRHTYAAFSIAAEVALFTLARRMGTSVERIQSW